MIKYIYLLLSLTPGIVFFACKNTQSKPLPVPVVQAADTPVQEITLLFMGDVMQHGPQIRAAYIDSLKTYDYAPCFSAIAPIALDADFTVANLELTLAGEPYSGYPQFSAPDELAVAMKNAGIRYFVTANNHSCDRGKSGIMRTVDVLDSLGITHTGTFKNAADKEKNRYLVLAKNGIKVVVLNYTYGTNGIPVPAPTIVNLIDSAEMQQDITAAKKLNPDKIVAFVHWGEEYQQLPNAYQKQYARFLLKNGVDYIIGSHPHVLQPMEMWYDSIQQKEQLVVYSLGNFVSNQRDRYKDGGTMFKLVLDKKDGQTTVKEGGYLLTWVDIAEQNGDKEYIVYPVGAYETDTARLGKESIEKMQLFRTDSRQLFDKHNKNLNEYLYNPKTGKWQLKK